MIDLSYQGNVAVVTMRAEENRLNRGFIDRFSEVLDEVEAGPPASLVTTGEGKYYSNGLDLEWLSRDDTEDMRQFVVDVEALMARLLAFPRVTVAALNGHTFAAGAMNALAHDFRVMREDRGWFCLPEIDIGIPFSDGMDSLIRHKLAPAVAHKAMVTGHRFTAPEALEAHIVDAAVAEDQVVARAVAIAAEHADKSPSILRDIKSRMYAGTIRLLEESEGTEAS
ncbi:MAG: enoyl-CoA hydratase/isomerase family protein [Acidimicrobiia bacterium]|nr:enoyl-CoA hydratase/isomerase family protein [Acidimicrobiia bacterium]NNC75860.1 enoyl-CoA hydratase/isomerase family protein [Acidimicrobiia bacterium]